jgi:glycosyltransferase involved in cell wall biosynthesis
MRQKKTLLLISNKVYHYRIPIYEHLNERLARIGYKIVVVTDEVEAHIDRTEGFTLLVEPFSFPAYKKLIERTNPEIVMFFLHARDLMVWPLLSILKLRSIPVIYWNHGINLTTPNNVVKRAVFGLFHRFADAIVLYSDNERKYVARRYWRKLFIANNTINFRSIPEIPDSKSEIREQLDIPFKKVVLFVGRITKIKRLGDLLEAAVHLNDDIGVVIVGAGLSSEQKALVDAAENIRYLGAIYDLELVNRIFKMADVFSIPGKVGLGVNQAFYWGLPIVTENVLHSPEFIYVKNGVNGFVVDKHDTRMLADKINQLLSSDNLYRQFSEAARSEILENASIDKMCDGFINAVEFLDNRNHAD